MSNAGSNKVIGLGEVANYREFQSRLCVPQEKQLVPTKPEKMVGESRVQYRARMRRLAKGK